mgnify:CR=1 FL=1
MHLGELKAKPIEELIGIAEDMGIENIARSKKPVSYTHLTLPTKPQV